MGAVIENIDEAALSVAEAYALDILTNVSVGELNRLKNAMALTTPGRIGPTTVKALVALCERLGLDLGEAGVNAFKDAHGLGNTGPVRGIIGPQTAGVYLEELLARSLGTDTAAGRRINEAGLALVKEYEGLHRRRADGRIEAYLDPVGIPTIGYGHTAGVSLGQVVTRDEAEALLLDDLNVADAAIERLVHVPLNVNQLSALVSFVFNVGSGAFGASTLLRRLNGGDYDGAANEFGRWVHGGGQVLPGLVRRRRAERALFLA